jgi:electron transfer flavoprotein alpha subunit
VLVWAEVRRGEVTTQSLRLLDQVRGWGEVAVVWVGPGGNEATVTEMLGRHGAGLVLHAEATDGAARLGGVLGGAVEAALDRTDSEAVVLPAGARGTEVAALVAARRQAPVAVDLAAAEPRPGGGLRFRRTALGGAWKIVGELRGNPGILTLLDNGEPLDPLAESVTPHTDAVAAGADPVTLVSSRDLPDGGQRLIDATAVVVVGRGAGRHLDPARDLAARLGGVVGGSRAAVDAGWLDRSAQVGLTGATISPQLYVGLGVSGAVHHLAGMAGARRIVAVTTDPDAPLLKRSDLGVIGDLATVLPQTLAALADVALLAATDPESA